MIYGTRSSRGRENMARRKHWEGAGEPLFGEDWWLAEQRLFANSLTLRGSRSRPCALT
jgi:hypothetical protein